MSFAALLSSFDEYSSFQWPESVAPTPLTGPDPLPFPANVLGLRVLLAFGADPTADPATWPWTDVSAYVQYEQRIFITRGRRNEQTQSSTSTCRFRLLNPAGIFSPRNIYGPYWGMLRHNTPIRVEVNPGTGWHTRYTGLVPEWNPRQDISGNYRYIPIEAEGVLRRLGQGDTPLRSALYRAILAAATASLLAWWPCEDGTDAGAAASGLLSNTARLSLSDGAAFSSHLTAVGTGTSVDISTVGSSLRGATGITSASATSWEWEVALGWSTLPTGGEEPFVLGFDTPGSLWREWGLEIYDDVNGDFRFGVYSADTLDGVVTLAGGSEDVIEVDRVYTVRVVLEQVGADIRETLYVDGTQIVTALTGSVSTLFTPTQQHAPAPESGRGHGYTGVGMPSCINHLTIWSPARSASDTHAATIGYDGELAGVRADRLSREEVVFADVALATSTEPMGPQTVATLLTLQREAELADEGLIVERLDSRFGFDPHRLRYNRDVTLSMDWVAHQIADVPETTDDDLLTRNDVTVTRRDGSSGRAVDEDGPLGTDGATGVGRYDEGKTVVLFDDDQPAQHAGWRKRLGTIDEQRFPNMKINLRRNPDLVNDWLRMDIGHRYRVNNHPTQDMPPDPIDQILEGYTEAIDQFIWEVWLNGSPALAYEVLQIETGAGNRSRIAAGVSTTDVAYDDDDISPSVTSAVIRWIDSATYPSRFPIIIIIAGEVMTCTAITGTGLTQAFTVTRALYGTPKPLPANSLVQLWRPAAIAL